METPRPRLSRRLIAAACGMLLTLAACSSREKPPKPAADCTAIEPQRWITIPPEFNYDSVAQALGVSRVAAEQGVFGAAACRTAVTLGEIEDGSPRVSIEGIAPNCMIVGILGEDMPQPDKKYKNILAMCAPLKPDLGNKI